MNKMSQKMGVVVQPEMKNIKGVTDLKSDDDSVGAANRDMLAEPLDTLHDDFMELWLQFGHVFLFSSVYPLAAFFALGNCLLSLKIDAWKLCKLMRKPTPRGVRDIGAWYMAFSITSVISVMTNLTLLSLDKDVQAFAPQSSSKDWVLLFVF